MWQITGRLNLEPHSANYAHFTWEASDSGTNTEKLRQRIKLVNYTIYGTLSSMGQKWINKLSEKYLADIFMKRITTEKHAKNSSWVYHCIPAPPSHKFNSFQQPIASDTSLCQAIHLASVRATVLLTIWPTPCNELPLSQELDPSTNRTLIFWASTSSLCFWASLPQLLNWCTLTHTEK